MVPCKRVCMHQKFSAVKKISLSRTFQLFAFGAAVLSVALVGALWLYDEIKYYQYDIERTREEYVKDRREMVRSYAVRGPEFVSYRVRQVVRGMRSRLESEADSARAALRAVWRSGRGSVPRARLKRQALAVLRQLASLAAPRPQVAVLDQSGRVLISIDDPLLEGTVPERLFGVAAGPVLKQIEHVAETASGEGVVELDDVPDGPLTVQVRSFDPFGWRVLAADRLGKLPDNARRGMLGRLALVRFQQAGQLIISDVYGNVLMHDGGLADETTAVWELPGLSGLKSLWTDRDVYRPQEERVVLFSGAGDDTTRLVGFRLVPETDWIIFADLTLNDADAALSKQHSRVMEHVRSRVWHTVAMLLLILILLYFGIRSVTGGLAAAMERFTRFFERAGTNHASLQPETIPFTEFERLAHAANRMVSEREAAAHALLESEQRYRATFESAALGIAHVDADGRWLEVNDRFIEMMGYPREVLLGMHGRDTLMEGEINALSNACIMLTQNGGRHVLEQTHRRSDGSLLQCRITLSPVCDTEAGEPYCICMVEDVGEQKRTEAALRRAKDEAEASARARGEFLANMSHELRTPLNGVLGMLQLLEDSNLNTEQLENVRLARQSGKSLLSIIGDVLDLSKMEAGMFGLSSEPFKVSEMLEKMKQTFEVLADEKGIKVRLDVDDSVPEILVGDEMRLRQILFNLVGNAVKFTEDGEVVITAQAARLPDSSRMNLLLSVEDTGVGIPHDKLDDVFRDFTQLDGSRTRRYQGTGLGLAIVRRLVTLMDGQIHVESEPGKGTELTVAVPLEKPVAMSSVPVIPRGRAVELDGLRVLVVEDEPVNARTITRMLEKAGYVPAVAENGLVAVEALRERQFDLVLMDIQMPVMDGLQALSRIRTDPALEHASGVPVVALTARAMAGDRERFLDAGMDGYVSKPIDRTELFSVIAEVLGVSGTA